MNSGSHESACASGQVWDPETYAANARFVAELAGPVVELLAPQPGESILDLGCGDGALTEQLARIGCEVVGIDSSPEQIRAAQARGLVVLVADGHDFNLGRTFNAVFSNAALHWMRDPARVLRSVRRALKPGGRFVGEFGGAGNTAAVCAAIRRSLSRRGLDFASLSPWYFPTCDEYRLRLEAADFQVQSIALIPRPTKLPGSLSAWLETFAGTFTAGLREPDRTAFFGEIETDCRPELCNAQGEWTVDYVRLRFAAVAKSRSA